MTPRWEQICSTSASRWLDTRTVVPSEASALMSERTSRVPCGRGRWSARPGPAARAARAGRRRSPGAAASRGVGAVPLARRGEQTHPVERGVDAARGRPRVGSHVGCVEPGEVGAAREVRVERRALDERTDPVQRLPRPLRHGVAEDAAAARRGLDETEQHPDRRGLARPVGAEEAVDRPTRHRERDPVDGDLVAEALREAHGHHRRLGITPGGGDRSSGAGSPRRQRGIQPLRCHRADGEPAVVGEHRGEQCPAQQPPAAPLTGDPGQGLQSDCSCSSPRRTPPEDGGTVPTATAAQPSPTTRGLSGRLPSGGSVPVFFSP